MTGIIKVMKVKEITTKTNCLDFQTKSLDLNHKKYTEVAEKNMHVVIGAYKGLR